MRNKRDKKNRNQPVAQLPQLTPIHSESSDYFPIVGIGSSAGGISALESFFMNTPPESGMGFIVIQHLESTYKSKLSELIQHSAQMEVTLADNGMKVSPNCVYITPSDKDLTIDDGVLYLVDRPADNNLHLPIDHFFRALANDQGDNSIGVILSGMGSDGLLGMQAIKNKNGFTFAQEPSSCEFDSMPQSVIDSGCIDKKGFPEELPGLIIALLKHDFLNRIGQEEFDAKQHGNNLKKILNLLYERTAHDFSSYKKSTLYRRIERRFKACNVENIAAYAQYIHDNFDETDILFKELLINVTYFFRDPEVWEYLKATALPEMISRTTNGRCLRAWIPACSTGEEAYTLAMLFHEALDELVLKESFSLQIFATDLDPDALGKARVGNYPLSIAEHVSQDRLNRFFRKHKNGYQIIEDIREMIVFADHDLTKDTPFSKLDFLCCRNLLIYFNRELQENLLPMFYYALNPDGFLLLGTAETIGRYDHLFRPLDVKLPIYKRLNNATHAKRLHYSFSKRRHQPDSQKQNDFINRIKCLPTQKTATLNSFTPINFMVSDTGEIVYKIDNTISYYDSIKQNDDPSYVSDLMTMKSLMFELQTAREEIHAVHEEMQTSQEELRSSNEELRATNEDLLHANDKLKGINEELNDSKIKLMTAYEHLKTSNSELTTYIKAIGELALVSVTDRSGIIIEANNRFCEISGYTRNELIGQTHSILNSKVHPRSFFVDMWRTIASGNIWHKEICNKTKNGELYRFDSVIVPLKDDNEQIERYISISVDISRRKRTEQLLIERLKEKNSLYAIHREMVKETSLSILCNKIIKNLTAAMHFPKLTACSIRINDELYTSANYEKRLSTHFISADIKVKDEIHGQMGIFYTEKKPFLLPDEQSLIDFTAEGLGIWLERRNHTYHIQHVASHDALTCLPNRLLLQDRITKALDFNRRHHNMTAVLFIDLDNFKFVNDAYGHNIGDHLLKKVAARFISSIRSEDTIARQGGDEFIVVLPHLIESNVAERVAQKILDRLSEPFHIEEKEFYLTCSIGIALFPLHGENADTLLKHSDMAMYEAKSSGRNTFRYFTEEMNLKTTENHKITNYLRHAIRNDQLLLYFQPIVDASNNLISLEALLRWQHPQEGWISPEKFIPLAEETGLILPLGEWVIKSACMYIKAWIAEGLDVPKISINLSAKQFQHKKFIDNLQRILESYDVSTNHFILEITESSLMEDKEKVAKTLVQLNAKGFLIAIDDFGTGYSNLGYLKHYPIDKLKIDRSFVSGIPVDENDSAIVAATIQMAHSLSIKVIAEGVETKEQFSFLEERGCDFFQGYFFSKTKPIQEIKTLLQKNTVSVNDKKCKNY